MDERLVNAMVAVVAAIIALATLSAVLSKQANTASVIGAASSGLSQLIGAAVSPITGGGSSSVFGNTGVTGSLSNTGIGSLPGFG